MERLAVLVVDDEETVREFLSDFLSELGYQVRVASAGPQALEMLSGGSFDAVLLDVLMPGMNGLEVLERYRSSGGEAPVVVLSALNGADDAVRAMKLGASDYLSKPFDNDELCATLARALGREAPAPASTVSASRKTPELEAAPGAVIKGDGRGFVSVAPAMARARVLVERIADTDVPVLLLGESGSGKEVVAREIHRRSNRERKPFIKVNCAALPAELLESELFGHEKGAFTGATAEKPGKFELANGGTIFLDEIGEMAVRLQAKLLQVLQDEEFYRVGGKKSVRVDARVVVATNRDLESEIDRGNFREDLYYRLNVVSIRLPPLRERREDVLPLVEHFLRKHAGADEPMKLPAEVLEAFVRHDWPGNVRELENMVRRLVVLKDPGMVLDELASTQRSAGTAPSLPTSYAGEGGVAPPEPHTRPRVTEEVPGVRNELAPVQYENPFTAPQPPPPPMVRPIEEMSLKEIGKRASMLAEREAILAMLMRTGWNKRRAATHLRISYKALLYKIKETGIVDPRSRAEM